MSQNPSSRNYSMSDGDLKQKADGIVNSILRDSADFAARNVVPANITAFKALITDFDNHSTDEELLGVVMDATEAKNIIAENVRKAIRPIRNMAEIVYEKKGKYNSFGFDDMNDMGDANLYRLAKRVVRMGTKYLAELAPQGLTAAQLTALQTLATGLDTALDTVEDAIENRDIETQTRINKGNLLWDELTKLSSVGKSIYADTNEAKYNDYVLEPSVGKIEPTPPAVG